VYYFAANACPSDSLVSSLPFNTIASWINSIPGLSAATVPFAGLGFRTGAQFWPYTSSAVYLWAFDTAPVFPPAIAGSVTNSHFTRSSALQGPSNGGHYGVAQFNGISDMINLALFPDANGNSLTGSLGGAGLAFELWTLSTVPVQSTAQLVDLSNGYLVNEVSVAVSSSSLTWRLWGNGAQYKFTASTTDVLQSTWQHLFCQINPSSLTTGDLSCTSTECSRGQQ
jgi:hypothetical protein